MSIVQTLEQLGDLDAAAMHRLGVALSDGEGRPITRGELTAIIAWANDQLTGAVLLGLILRGDVLPRWSPERDEWMFVHRSHPKDADA